MIGYSIQKYRTDMLKRILLCQLLILSVTRGLRAQDIQMTRTGRITFHAGSSLEDIDATNNEVASAFNAKTGELAFTVLVKSFHFRRTLMEEHFNEVYMQSNKFPRATFSGKVVNVATLNLTKDGDYPVNVEGDLSIHGVTKKISIPGTIGVNQGKISSKTKYPHRYQTVPIFRAFNRQTCVKCYPLLFIRPCKKLFGVLIRR